MIDSTDRKFLATAEAIAQIWSKDPSTKVGALAVGRSKNQVAFGYNGLPPGIFDSHERLHDREVKLALTLHAEENALANATFPVSTIYVTHHPCLGCVLRILAKRSVRRIVYIERPEFEARWAASLAEARVLLKEAGVMIEGVVL